MLGFAFTTSVVSLFSVSLSNSPYNSAPLTNAWLVSGDVCDNVGIRMV